MKYKESLYLQFGVFLLSTFVFLILLCSSVTLIYNKPDVAFGSADTTKVVSPGGRTEILTGEWYKGEKSDEHFVRGVYTASYRFTLDESAIDDEFDFLLVIPRIAGNAIDVQCNGGHLGRDGDMKYGRSNVWNSAKIFQIPKQVIRKDNIIELHILGLYEAGVHRSPYLVRADSYGSMWVFLVSFFSDKLVWALWGAVLCMGIAIFISGAITFPLVDERFLLGIAIILNTFVLLDYAHLQYLPFPFIEFKRFVMIMSHMGTAFFIGGYLKLLHRRYDIVSRLFLILQLVSISVLFFPQTLFLLEKINHYTNAVIVLLPLYLGVLIILNRRVGVRYYVLLGGVIVGVACGLRDIALQSVSETVIVTSHYGFASFVLSTIAFIVADFVHHYDQLNFTRRKAELYKEASLRDPMTGLFNRNIISVIRKKMECPFSLVVIDLNRFKQINDTYGHNIGDQVLVDLAERMSLHFRSDDYVVRIGGDEFVVILPECHPDQGWVHVNELKDELLTVSIGDAGIGYSISAGVAYSSKYGALTEEEFDEIIRLADEKMYDDKSRRK